MSQDIALKLLINRSVFLRQSTHLPRKRECKGTTEAILRHTSCTHENCGKQNEHYQGDHSTSGN